MASTPAWKQKLGRSILVAHHRQLGQRHVAIGIRTRCALGAAVARRDVAVSFAARRAIGPRALIAGTLAAELPTAALATTPLAATATRTSPRAVTIAPRIEIAARAARRARRPG